jgi:cobalt-zinc-cadmium efflux system outer membrane protein
VERARSVPNLFVSGGYKRTAGFNTGVLAVTVPVPLFDRNRAAAAVAEGELRAAEIGLAFVRNAARAEATVLADAADRLASYAADVERIEVEPAAVVRVAARAALEEGAGDLLRLVDAERVHAEVTRDVLDLRLDALLAAIDARLALSEEPLP